MIYVTGYGAFTAIGRNTHETYSSLISASTGIRKGKGMVGAGLMIGEIPLTNQELIDGYSLHVPGSRTALLGMIAAREAFSGHVVSDKIRTGVISGNSVGGMDMSEVEYGRFLKEGVADSGVFRFHANGHSTEAIARDLGIHDFTNTVSTACSSAANAVMMGARMIRQGLLDRVVVGGTDSLTSFTIAGFNSLMILDEEWCRPFDESRKGLNLGEGAGYIVIESENSLVKSGKSPLAVLSGWANASDAYHQTASSPEGNGAVLAMTGAIEMAGISPTEIGYVNAHGTGTPNNDLTESVALKKVFGDNVPPFSSTKPFTGHTLAACGGIEAVIAILSLRHHCCFPNLNCHTPIAETGLVPEMSLRELPQLRHVLSNSFGFGGNNSTLIFSAH